MDAVGHGCQLHDESRRGKGHDRVPVVLLTVFNVDVTVLTEAERDASEDEQDCDSDGWNTESAEESPPHEFGSEDNFPADLQVECDCADETPYHGHPAAE